MKIENINLECMRKAKLAAKKVVLSTVLASSILAQAGCSKKPVEEPKQIENVDENLDNEVKEESVSETSNTPIVEGNIYTDEDINKIIDAAYREGYTQGYYEAALLANINSLAHQTNQLFVGIVNENGEMNYSGINSLLCVDEVVGDENNYYIINCENEDTLYATEGRFDYITGTELDHNFDLDNIKTVRFEDYIKEYYGENYLQPYYDAYEQNSTDAFSKYDFSIFKQLEIYDTLSESKAK